MKITAVLPRLAMGYVRPSICAAGLGNAHGKRFAADGTGSARNGDGMSSPNNSSGCVGGLAGAT